MVDAEDGRIEVPFVKGGRTQAGFGIFGRSRVLDTDQLRVDAVTELEGEEVEERAIG